MLRTILLCFVGSAGLVAAEWMTDFAAAREAAASSEKDMVISFTGSDWCDKCQKLAEGVLSKDVFQNTLEDDYVLVTVDFPMGNPELSRSNEPLRIHYGVPGYPALVLADSEAKPYGLVSYERDWGTDDYLENIKLQERKKEKRDAALEKYEVAQQPEEQIAALEEALGVVPSGTITTVYRELVEELRKLSNDESPLVRRIYEAERLEELKTDVQALMTVGKFEEAIARANESYENEKASVSEKRAALAFRYYCQINIANYEGAYETATDLARIARGTPMAKQALTMRARAKAQMGKEPKTKPSRPAEPAEMAPTATERSGEGPVSRTEAKAAGGPDPVREKAVAELETVHTELAEAEKALQKARDEVARLEAKRAELDKKHLKAHADEEKTRGDQSKLEGEEIPLTDEQDEETPADEEQAPEGEQQAPEVETLEQEANELKEKAEALREKARALQERN
ncbi:MAG: thioredoxin family protein [Verrucomicrobiota bacterium JB023]|nr:thioredoxin family protein [Verrucomicrobiota bacterium JB023]